MKAQARARATPAKPKAKASSATSGPTETVLAPAEATAAPASIAEEKEEAVSAESQSQKASQRKLEETVNHSDTKTSTNKQIGSPEPSEPLVTAIPIEAADAKQRTSPEAPATRSPVEFAVDALTKTKASHADAPEDAAPRDTHATSATLVATNDEIAAEKSHGSDGTEPATSNVASQVESNAQQSVASKGAVAPPPSSDAIANRNAADTQDLSTTDKTHIVPSKSQATKPLSSRIQPETQAASDLAARLKKAHTREPEPNPVATESNTNAEKRKRSYTPPRFHDIDTRPSKAVRLFESNYDKFAAQRREPSPEPLGADDFRIIATDKNKHAEATMAAYQQSKASPNDLVPAACVKDLVCVFVGNIPPATINADIKPWLASSRHLPRPVAISTLGQARNVPNGHQYTRIFFEKKTQAEQAMNLLKNLPFETPPAQLVVRVLEQKPEKTKLHWRDVESWARPVLEKKLDPSKTGVPALPSRPDERQNGKVQDQSRTSLTGDARRAEAPRDDRRDSSLRDDRRDDRSNDLRRSRSPPRRRERSPPRTSGRDVDRLADRLREEPRYEDRREADGGRRPLYERTQSSSSLPRSAKDNSPRDNLMSRVREPDYDNRRPRASWPDDRPRGTNDDVFRRFDASPPRRQQREPARYSPDREVRHNGSRRQGSNLLGRLQ